MTDLSKLSDQELVGKFLQEKDQKIKTLIRDEIFGRHCQKMDQGIRAYLKSQGITYSPDDESFNYIFNEIYKRIFLIFIFEKKIKKFDVTKDFEKYFIAVVRNEVRDWLKKRDPETGLSIKDILMSATQKDIKEEIQDEPKDNEKEKQERIIKAINRLSSSHRIIIRLRFIAYEELKTDDINWIAKQTKISVEKIKEKINKLKEHIKNSDEFKKNNNIEFQLSSLKLMIDNQERKIFAIIKILEGSGYHIPNGIKEEVERLSFKNIKIDRKRLIEEGKVNGGSEENWQELQLINLKGALKRLGKIRKKREDLLRKYHGGQCYARPEYRDMADILGINEKTVGTRKNRAKKALWENLTGEGEDPSSPED